MDTMLTYGAKGDPATLSINGSVSINQGKHSNKPTEFKQLLIHESYKNYCNITQILKTEESLKCSFVQLSLLWHNYPNTPKKNIGI